MSAPAGPGFFASARAIAAKDLRIEGKTLENLSSMVLFSLIVLVVFNFAFDLSTVRRLGVGRIVPGILWTTLAFAGIVGFARSFQIETRNDSLTALLLAPVDRSALFAGKALSNFATLLILELLILPLSAVFFDFNLFAVGGPLVAVVVLHTIGLAELGTLLGAIASRVGRGEAMLATLLFPVATPLFISAVKSTAAVVEGDPLTSVGQWLLVAAGFDLLYFFVGLATFEYVIEE